MFKRLVLLFVFLAVAGGAAYHYTYSKSKKESADAKPAARVLVSVAPVARQDMPLDVSAVGTVTPYQSVTVRARIDSQITEVSFKAGDYVKPGDLLFTLDDRAIKAQIAEQQANLTAARAQSQNLKLQHERKAKLFAQGFETREGLDAASSADEAQSAAVAATQAAIENLKVQLQYTRITAPIGGRTGTIGLTVGNNVKANDATPLVTINQVKPVWAQVSLPQKYMDELRAAQSAGPVKTTAQHEGGKAVEGALDYLDNAVDPATGTFALRALFPNEDELLWPGMFVNVTLTLGTKKDARAVPEVAVQHGPDGDFVYVAADGKAAKRPVTVDFLQGGEAVIAQGLEGDERVVTDGMLKLGDGANIAIAGEDK